MTERFELLEQLGRGGMGTVWKARDAETGEFVALKLLHPMYVDDPDYVARFEREVEITRRIDSPFVVNTLGYGKRDGVPYVAMEFVAGQSLRDRLRASGPFDWDEAKRIATELAQALAAAHAVGVIHRDIKPSNVLLDSEGNVKLVDFGISRATDLTRMTGSVTVLGTPAYMSPDGNANEQSDLYALGCVLYEILSGSPPFEGDSQQQVLLKHVREDPNLETLPADSRKVVGWLLQKEPRRRPASAAALLAVLRGSSIRANRPGVASSASPHHWRGVVTAGVIGFTLLGLAAGGALGIHALVDSGDEGRKATPAATQILVATSEATSGISPTSTAGATVLLPPSGLGYDPVIFRTAITPLLTWDAPASGAEGYQLETTRFRPDGIARTDPSSDDPSCLSAADRCNKSWYAPNEGSAALASLGPTYSKVCYRVRTYLGGAFSAFSQALCFVQDPSKKPTAPAIQSVRPATGSPSGKTCFTIEWATASGADIVGFQLLKQGIVAASMLGDSYSSTADCPSKSEGSPICYSVRSYNADGLSDASPSRCVTLQ